MRDTETQVFITDSGNIQLAMHKPENVKHSLAWGVRGEVLGVYSETLKFGVRTIYHKIKRRLNSALEQVILILHVPGVLYVHPSQGGLKVTDAVPGVSLH